MTAQRREPVAILMTEHALQRVQSRIERLGAAIEPVVMETAGVLRKGARTVSVVEANPSVAWAGSDVWVEGRFPALAKLALDAPNLQWFQSGAAGYDNPFFERLARKSVRITTCHAPSEAVADFVMASVLDHFQRGPERRDARARKLWAQLPFREVAGSSWLIIGFGAIGQGVARRARGFGAHAVGIRRTSGSHALADFIATPDALPDLLPRADVVVLCLPLDRNTLGMVDRGFLARLKQGSVLVNVSRGGVIDDAALLESLDHDRPGHAVLDVFAIEPLPTDHPFWSHPKVALTAHVAGMGSGLVARSDDLFIENLERFITARPLLHEVSVETVLALAATRGRG